MCEPMTLAIGAAVASASAAGLTAVQGNAQAQYRAKIAERNAVLEREAGVQAQQNMRDEAQAKYREIARIKGQQRVAAGANGVAIDFGTAGDVQADTQAMGSEDVKRIYQKGDGARKGADIGASNFLGEANASRSAGTAALIGGALDMGSSLLSGASQYGALKDTRLTRSASKTIRNNAAIF